MLIFMYTCGDKRQRNAEKSLNNGFYLLFNREKNACVSQVTV